MCVSPVFLPNGSQVACRKCWQCAENRVNDWVGRCIAEMETSKASYSVTLTYGREDGEADHLRAAVLTYSDVQKYLKRLRKDGFPCRYFAVGEYGTMKGRSHWHIVLFFSGAVPPHELHRNFRDTYWPHGHAFWDMADGPSVRYVCKYIQKDLRAAERQGHLAMSKKPPLGARFFEQRAREFVKAGLAPRDAFYSFTGYERGERPHRYMLRGRSLDLFCEAFVREWTKAYPGQWWPHSDLIEAFLDRRTPEDLEWRPNPVVKRAGAPWADPPGKSVPAFSEAHNAYFVWHNGQRLWWSYDLEGNRGWHAVIRTEQPSAQLRRLAAQYREASQTPSVRRSGPYPLK